MKLLKCTRNMSYEDWYAERSNGIGGSEIGAIMGVCPYSSPLLVFVKKLGIGEEQEDNDSMYWGRELEPVVKREFTRRMKSAGVKLRVTRFPYIIAHDDFDYMRANIDYAIMNENGEEGILECKTAK